MAHFITRHITTAGNNLQKIKKKKKKKGKKKKKLIRICAAP